jgi:hypothetical protein
MKVASTVPNGRGNAVMHTPTLPQSADGSTVNADLNGAANILRKVARSRNRSASGEDWVFYSINSVDGV